MTTSVLDLDEVGEFFSELIQSNRLDLKMLPLVGFDFLSMYFISQNDLEDKLTKINFVKKIKTKTYTSGGYYGASKWKDDDSSDDDDEQQIDDATVKVNVDPSQLTKIDMIWQIALEVEDEVVV